MIVPSVIDEIENDDKTIMLIKLSCHEKNDWIGESNNKLN